MDSPVTRSEHDALKESLNKVIDQNKYFAEAIETLSRKFDKMKRSNESISKSSIGDGLVHSFYKRSEFGFDDANVIGMSHLSVGKEQGSNSVGEKG